MAQRSPLLILSVRERLQLQLDADVGKKLVDDVLAGGDLVGTRPRQRLARELEKLGLLAELERIAAERGEP